MSAERLALRARVSYPGFELEVDEEIPLDRTTALFGPSGSGKSTLLRVIAGFDRPTAGRIALGADVWFDGAGRVDVPPHRRPVGLMFQDGRLFDHLDVAGNLEYALRRSRRSGSGEERRAVVDALDLEPLLPRRTASLSGGERQRVALGRTLLTRPRLLLLDEPLAALDRDRKREILPYLEQLPRRFRLPTIYVSHAVEEVALLADEVIVLAGGRVRARGATGAIVERLDLQPITGRFEAGVLVEGRVTEHDRAFGLTHVDIGGARLTMPGIADIALGAGVRLRIRARDVAIATSAPSGISIRNVLPATVLEIVADPDSAFAEVLLRMDGEHLRARLTRASVADLQLVAGMPVFALIKTVSFDRRL